MSTIEGIDAGVNIPALMTVEQLAKILNVSVRTVWRLRSAGQVPRPLKIAGGVRWRVADIKAWIEQGCPGRPGP